MNKEKLAIFGGPKIRKRPLPYRKLFGKKELMTVKKVFKDSWREEIDFGYQGKYENLFTDSFCKFQGGGFADAVSSGTAAIYLALKALNIKPGSDVIVSPITNPGGVSPIIIQGMKVVLADSQPNSFLVGPEEFKKALTRDTKAAILTHSGGKPINMEPILKIAKSKGVKIIEDCSQAHGAICNGKKVGCFGDIAIFSTMFSKTLATGGCGGLIYTQKKDYYWLIRSLADRGKPFHNPTFNPKDSSKYLFPALNFNLDELSCAIGFSILSKLQEIIDKRLKIVCKIDSLLKSSSVVFPSQQLTYGTPSPFFHTVEVAIEKLKVSKKEFAEAIAAEGVWINPHYSEVVCEWKWMQKYLKYKSATPNAIDFRNRSFNILFNERFTNNDIFDVIVSILKVEKVFVKNEISE